MGLFRLNQILIQVSCYSVAYSDFPSTYLLINGLYSRLVLSSPTSSKSYDSLGKRARHIDEKGRSFLGIQKILDLQFTEYSCEITQATRERNWRILGVAYELGFNQINSINNQTTFLTPNGLRSKTNTPFPSSRLQTPSLQDCLHLRETRQTSGRARRRTLISPSSRSCQTAWLPFFHSQGLT